MAVNPTGIAGQASFTARDLPSGSSLSDVLTALKNLVEAINNASRQYMNVQGLSTLEGISTATVVKSSPGRIATVSIITAGSTPGSIYDSTSTSNLTKSMLVVPNTLGVFAVSMATNSGLMVVPGTGQVLTIGFS